MYSTVRLLSSKYLTCYILFAYTVLYSDYIRMFILYKYVFTIGPTRYFTKWLNVLQY